MNHEIRRTSPKLHQRLDLVSAHRARESVPIEIFELCELSGPEVDPLIWLETADPAGWRSIPWGSTWGRPRTDFVLHSRFTVPVGWGDDTAADEVRLRLPIGRAGDFSHPEALVYVDGVPLAACDRHHQELRLPARFCDGTAHELVLHGWTGGVPEATMGPRRSKPPLVMSECSLERIDRAVARFEALARVALGVADQLDLDDPNRAGSSTMRSTPRSSPSTPVSRSATGSSSRPPGPGNAKDLHRRPGPGAAGRRVRRWSCPHRRRLAVDGGPDET